MRRWSLLAERLAATSRTSEKTNLLAEYFRIARRGRAADRGRLPDRPGLRGGGSAGDRHRLVGDRDGHHRGRPGHEGGPRRGLRPDLGPRPRRGRRAHAGRPRAADPRPRPSLVEVAEAFTAIEVASGPARKAAILRDLLVRSDPVTAKGIVKVLGGELRIGLRDGLVEAAIAKAFDRPLEDVKWAGMLVGDMGRLAQLARDDQLATAELALFNPLKFMLASPAEDADEILRRLGPEVWVEDKYDGIRAQLHKRGTDVRLYSRDLHDIGGQFPEIVEAARPLAWDGILDGEILAWKDGLVLPFIALQGRLGRKSPSAAIQADVPVIYVAFDALAIGAAADGSGPVEALLREPLRTRRERLDAIDLPSATEGGRFIRSFLAVADDADALEAAFAAARARRNEGLMVKDPTSGYSPGSPRPGLAEDEEGARDHRLRRRRRRGRPRQASRRPVRLHVRRSRHRDRPAGHDRQGVQRPDRRRDRRDDPLVRGPHDRPVRALSRGRAARSSSRSPST